MKVTALLFPIITVIINKPYPVIENMLIENMLIKLGVVEHSWNKNP